MNEFPFRIIKLKGLIHNHIVCKSVGTQNAKLNAQVVEMLLVFYMHNSKLNVIIP